MSAWNETLPAAFCEGKLYPYLVPHFYEFFSAMTGLVLTAIAIYGLLQPRIEVILKLMYGGIFVSGLGTFLLHFNRIAAFNFADVFPLLITLTLGLIAFFDEVVFEWRRPEYKPAIEFIIEERDDRIRAALDLVFYSIWLTYLVIGLILIVFPPVNDIFSLYFGPPYAVVAVGGMIYLYFSQRNICQLETGTESFSRQKKCNQNLLKLMILAIVTAVIAIIFKLLDTYACNKVIVWFFPHPLFHIFLTYSTHCVIVFLGFYRSNNMLHPGQKPAKVLWRFYFLPYIYIPLEVSDTHKPVPTGEKESASFELTLRQ